MSQLAGRRICQVCILVTCLCTIVGCSTQTYFREDGAKVTVKKFAGIPYLEKEERTKVVPAGSEIKPTE